MAITTRPPTARLPAALLIAAMVAGCAASQAEYPSLQVRPGERIEAHAAEPPAEPAEPEPADLLARAEEHRAAALAADAAFRQLVAGATARAQAARGAAIASDRWSEAQVSIAMLDLQRSATASALADLDLLYAERALALESRSGIDAARTDVVGILAEQDGILAKLKGMIEQ